MDAIANTVYEIFKEKKYNFFIDTITYKLNIFIVRADRKSGKFPDFLYVIYRDAKLDWRIHQYECYCPDNIISGQYVDAYKIGHYKEPSYSQTALVQRNNTVKMIDQKGTIKNNYLGVHVTYPESVGINTIKLSSQYHYKDMFKLLHIHRELHDNVFTLTIL